MTFLNPTILFGLIAASIPVIIHLLNLKKLKKIEFSTIAFLKELQQSKIRRVKLKQWLLLALRTLIILFIVTAFARPTLQNVSLLGTASAAKSSTVFILDNTFSMSAVTDKGSYLNQAKQIIKEILDESQTGDEFAVISISGVGKNYFQFTDDKTQFLKTIDDINPSYISRTLHEAMIEAGQIIASAANPNKEIYILSDFQKSRIVNDPYISIASAVIFPSDTKLYQINIISKEPTNLAITDFEVNNQIFEINKSSGFTATITNYFNREVKNRIVSLFINDKREAQQTVTLKTGATKQITFEATLKESGLVKISVELENDDIIQDNSRFISIYIPAQISLAIFTDNISDAYYINAALATNDLTNSINITNRSTDQIQSTDLHKYDCVFIIGADFTAGLENLRQYIYDGGEIILTPGSKSSLEEFKSVLTNLNLPKPESLISDNNKMITVSLFDKIDFDHPLFSNLFIEDEKRLIESPKIFRYFKITTTGLGKNIISLLDGSPFLSEYQIGKGKVLLYNAAPILTWSDFSLKGIFAPLINKSVRYLVNQTRNTESIFAGDDIFVDISKGTALQIITNRPDSTTDYSSSKDFGNKKFFKYSNTDLTGIYTFYAGDKLLDYAEVNTDPRESIMDYLSPGEFSDYLTNINYKGNVFNINPDEDFTASIKQSRYGTELWQSFIIIAFILALIEMTISRSAKKDIVGLNKNS